MATFKLSLAAFGALAAAAGLCLGGCNTDSLGTSSALGLSSQSATAAPAKPPVKMAGRWRLVSAGGQACNMTFTAASGDLQGAVAPEGGCPGKFFTTRHWNFDHDTLRLLDHKNEPLVELKRNSAGRFEGEAANNGLVWLEQ